MMLLPGHEATLRDEGRQLLDRRALFRQGPTCRICAACPSTRMSSLSEATRVTFLLHDRTRGFAHGHPRDPCRMHDQQCPSQRAGSHRWRILGPAGAEHPSRGITTKSLLETSGCRSRHRGRRPPPGSQDRRRARCSLPGSRRQSSGIGAAGPPRGPANSAGRIEGFRSFFMSRFVAIGMGPPRLLSLSGRIAVSD